MNNTTSAVLQLEDYGWSAHFRRVDAELSYDRYLKLRVMAVHRDALDVAGPEFSGRILPVAGAVDEDQATIGDWLAVNPATHKILAIYPRSSVFKRRSAGRDARVQLIAANVDTVLIVTSANSDFNIARLERYLAIAHEAQVTPVIVITKADLADDANSYVQRATALQCGILVEAIDARASTIAEVLSPWLQKGQTLALIGSSGVGKSTMINSLLCGEMQNTSAIREDDARGRHTTTGRSMHRMPTGAWLMDTPGMRELQIIDAHHGIDHVFDDVVEVMRYCRFSDCTHQNEPGCAVRTGLEAGTLDASRLKHFEKLVREERYNSEAIHEAHARNKRFGKMARQAMRDKERKREW